MKVDDTTIVSAFYPLPNSKHDTGKFRAWIQNFCKIPCAMVIFTTEVYALEIMQWRRAFLDTTHVIVRPFDSFAMSCPSMMNFWQTQLNAQSSPDFYAFCAMKQEFVRVAINLNKFRSKWFVWCDIGIQRYSRLQEYYMTFPSEIERLCVPGRMTFLELNRIPESYITNWIEDKPMEYPMPENLISAACMAGDADAWNELGESYKEMLKEFAIRGWFAGKESDVFFAILMEKKAQTFRLFFAAPFGNPPVPGIEWLCFPVMLAGNMDAQLDTRFEPLHDN